MFGGFPDDVAWERVALTRDEVLAILYITGIGADELEVYLGVSPRIDGWSEW